MWWFAAGVFLVTGPGEAFINNMRTLIQTLRPTPTTTVSTVDPALQVSFIALTSTLSRLLAGSVSDYLAPPTPTVHLPPVPIEARRRRPTCSRMNILFFFALIMFLGLALVATGTIHRTPSLFWLVSTSIGAGYGDGIDGVVTDVDEKDPKRGKVTVTSKNLDNYLGVRKFTYGRAEQQNEVGLVTGLAWTEVGGDLLSIEATIVPGKGKLIHTGQLGDVMQESIQAALSVVRARVDRMGIDPEFHQKLDVHIHVPEGATPKDGPSAGIAMCTSLVSALTKIPVRSDVAMTGEITLRGRVLPIGGLKEKLLAAHRGGITTVIIPEENRKDLTEIPKNVTEYLDIRPVRWIDEVLDIALERPLTPTVREEGDNVRAREERPVETPARPH